MYKKLPIEHSATCDSRIDLNYVTEIYLVIVVCYLCPLGGAAEPYTNYNEHRWIDKIAENGNSCEVGKYGERCDYDCEAGCLHGVCDRYMGHCTICKDGKWGAFCDKPCHTGK